ncbi:hypothetical protein CPB84DRAFT_1293010 [Gymnopilus junonius]|uniref:Uncharacterized protein n=1 Tax=Gymnopilus junonius TaxID=109634 RepID=A0A9P5NMQ5_GYMJU|nr:hypothetical protein CPB84DRAFT_1293010 [Gymnopilus junonius]
METSLQFTVDDTSPTISYSPFRDTLSTPDLSAGWNPYYNLSGFIHAQGEVGNGTSLHITSLNGASLALQFHGTGIELRGNVTFASYEVSVDGQAISSPSSTSQNNILANVQNLKDGAHNVTLTAQIPQGQNPPNSTIVTFQPQQIDDSDIAFLGRWTFETVSSGASFHISKTAGDRAATVFNGTTFIMQGETSPDAGSYTVTLDNVTTTLNGRSSFTVDNALLFFASELNSAIEHSIVVENLDGGQLSILSGGVNVFVPLNLSASTPSSNGTSLTGATSAMSFPEGTIAAFILSGILGFILITGGLFYFLYYRPKTRRRRRQIANDRLERSPKEQEAGMVLDIGPNGVENFSKNVDYAEEDIFPIPDRRHSAMSGFSRWRREAVQGSLGGVNLPIHFRHSDSDEKNNSHNAAEERPGSGRSSDPPSSSSSAKRARAKRKGKMRQILGRSWSPSFMVDLPTRRSRPPTAEQSTSPRITSMGNLSSFVAAEPSPQKTRNADPPSYAASVSNHDSIRNSNSDPSSGIPSGPRSVSVNASYPRIHYHEDSRGFLLNEGEPDSDLDSRRVDPPPQHHTHHHQLPPAEAIPMMPLARHDAGSLSTEDDPSITEPNSMRQVLRSLSPRTSETPQRYSQRRRTVVAENPESQTESPGEFPPLHMFLEDEPEDQSETSKQLPRTPSGGENSEDGGKDGAFLSVRTTSPFRVDFDSQSTRVPNTSDGDAGSTDAPYLTAVSSNGKKEPSKKSSKKSSGRSARVPLPEFVQGASRLPFRLTPITWRPVSPPKQLSSSGQGSDGVTSFLDFSSSREGSMRSHSIRPGTSGSDSVFEARLSMPGPMEPRSRWSNTTAPTQTTGTAGSEQDKPIDENRLSVRGPTEPRSRWSNTTVPTISTGPAASSLAAPVNDSSSESSKDHPPRPELHSSDSNTFPILVHVVMPTPLPVIDTTTGSNPNPHRRSQASTSNQSNFTQAGEPLHVHPVLGNLESPTSPADSIPLTMSEIHFVNSDGEEAARSRRTTDVSSLPPGAPSDEFQPRPFDPSILVSRVLGTPPPSSATARPIHTRSASASATFNSFPSSSQKPGPTQSNDHLNSSANVSGQSLS